MTYATTSLSPQRHNATTSYRHNNIRHNVIIATTTQCHNDTTPQQHNAKNEKHNITTHKKFGHQVITTHDITPHFLGHIFCCSEYHKGDL